MTDKPKRRIRVRRKRRHADGVDDAVDVAGEFGCCLFEVVLTSAAMAALLAVPAGLLLW